MSGEYEVRIVNGETNRPLALDRELDPYARRADRREFARRTLGQCAFCCACALEPELSFRAIDDDLLRDAGRRHNGPVRTARAAENDAGATAVAVAMKR